MTISFPDKLFAAASALALALTMQHALAADDAKSTELDTSRPVPRELVLETFREMLDLPPEVVVEWDDAVADGRISRNIAVLTEYIQSRARKIDIEELGPPPSATLPDGSVAHGIYLELLGPNVGAEVTQEDLDLFIPDLAAAQRNVNDYQAERHQEWMDAEFPLIPMNLAAEDFMISVVLTEPSSADEWIEMEYTSNQETKTLRISKTPVVDGREVAALRDRSDPEKGPLVEIHLSEAGTTALAEATAGAVENPMQTAYILNGEILSAPHLRLHLTSGPYIFRGDVAEKILTLVEP